MGSPGCAAALQNIVEAVEFGNKPFPVFFTDATCTQGQWPPAGEVWPEALIGTPFSLRSHACTIDGTTPAPAFLDSSGGIGGFSRLPVDTCPLPAINTMFLPDFYTYRFWSVNGTTGAGNQPVQNPGAVELVGSSTTFIQQNLWHVDASSTNTNSGALWGSSTTGPFGDAYCGYVDSSAPFSRWFDQRTNNPTYSINSCGLPFWPSLSGVDTALTIYTDNDGTRCWTNNNQACGNSPGAIAANMMVGGNSQVQHCSNNSSADYTFQDCVYTEAIVAEVLTNAGTTGNTSGPICACGFQLHYDKFGACDYCETCNGGSCDCDGLRSSSTCNCFSNFRVGGSLDQIEILPTAGSWEIQQFRYCTGLDTLSVAGIPIQRYGNSTIACDPIVTSLCQNTAFVASNPQYAKACSCILEQQRFNIQFAGLNLPVQCFSTACADNDPNVYRTIDQSAQCSARLCSQIITINGSAIAAEGYQTMLCDGQTYVVNTSTNVSPGPVPTIPLTSPSNIQLGPTFYIALGLLGIMILLLAAWGIRKWVISRRQQQQRRKDILHSLERLASSAPLPPV